MRGLRIAVLGPLEVAAHDQRVTLSGRRQRELLAVLALRLGQAVSADTLAGSLYPEPLPKTATESIRMHITALRRAVAGASPALDAAIRTTTGGYLLDPLLTQTDVTQALRLVEAAEVAAGRADSGTAFRIAGQACELWRGEPLQDFLTSPFGQPSVAPLIALHARALKVLAEAALSLGPQEAELALAELSRAHDWHPWDDALVALRAHCQYRIGQQQAALGTIAAHRAALCEDLGLDLGGDLLFLEQQMLNHHPALAEPVIKRHSTGRRLVGREDDVAAALRAIDDPGVRLLLIGGQAGIGKTAVLRELAAQLQVPVVSPQADDGPYDGLRRALGLFPSGEQTRGVFADLMPSPALAISPLQHAVLDTGTLIVDDADQLDDSSAAVLQQVITQVDNPVTLVLGSRRPGALLAAWVATGADLRVLHLPSLPELALLDLVSTHRPQLTVDRAQDIVRRAAGNPGSLMDLINVVAAAPTPSRGRHSAALRSVLEAVEVLEPVTEAELCGVLNTDAATLRNCVRSATSDGLLHMEADRLRANRTRTGWPSRAIETSQRQRLHRALAGYLANSVRHQDAVRRGRHLIRAGETVPTGEMGNGVLAATRSAIALGWFAEADSLVAEALGCELAPNHRLLLRLEQARALIAAGEVSAAATQLWDVVDGAEQIHDGEIVTLGLLSLQSLGVAVGGDDSLLRAWGRAVGGLLPPPGPLRTKALCGAAYAYLTANRMAEALAHLDRADEASGQSALEVAMVAHARLLVTRMAPDPDRTARAQLSRLQQAALEHTEPEIEIRTRLDRTILALEDGDVGSASAALRGMDQMADAMGHPQARWISRAAAATLALCEGDFDAAAARSLAAAQLGTSLGVPEAVVAGAAFQLSLHERRDELAQLRPLLESMTDPPPTIAVAWHSGAALAALAVDDRASADRHWSRIRDRVHVFSPSLLAVTGDYLAADAASAVGDLATAQLIAARLAPIADRFVIVGSAVAAFGPVARVLALVAERSGDLHGATQMWALNDEMCSRGALAWHARLRP